MPSSILLVEDNPDDQLLTVDALTSGGIEADVTVARDGAEALDLLRDRVDLPKLILLDLKLPKLSGLQVLAHVRSQERTRRLPVVVLTSSTEEADLKRAYDLGANSYLLKPVEFDYFVDVVRSLGLYWLVHNRTPRQA